jgi:hypothetical protein
MAGGSKDAQVISFWMARNRFTLHPWPTKENNRTPCLAWAFRDFVERDLIVKFTGCVRYQNITLPQ